MITISQRAAKHIQRQICRRNKGIGILVGVRKTGCSGLAYTLEFVDDQPVATMFEQHDVKVFVNEDDMLYLKGTELDFVRDGLNEGFKFNNPNVKAECGCGESFQV